MGEQEDLSVSRVWQAAAFLLDMSLRISNMSGVHARESVGHELQQHNMDLSGLWPFMWLRQSIKPKCRRERGFTMVYARYFIWDFIDMAVTLGVVRQGITGGGSGCHGIS